MLVVDLSNNNGAVDLRQLRRAGVGGVILKVTEGESFVDRWFTRYRDQALAAGLRVGGYHFCQPRPGNFVREAAHFARHLGVVGRRDFRPTIDLEVRGDISDPTALAAYAHALARAVRAETGVCPLVYSYPAFLEAMPLRETVGCGLWLASYGRDDGREYPFRVPPPWKAAAMHQFTSRGTLPGLGSGTDISRVLSLRTLLAHPVRGRV